MSRCWAVVIEVKGVVGYATYLLCCKGVSRYATYLLCCEGVSHFSGVTLRASGPAPRGTVAPRGGGAGLPCHLPPCLPASLLPYAATLARAAQGVDPATD